MFPTQYTVMSLAYMYVSPEATEDGRSLENIANNVGPNTEPCGTATWTDWVPDSVLLTTVNCSVT